MTKKAFITVLALTSLYLVHTLNEAGVFYLGYDHFNGSIRQFSSPPGIEDLTIDHTSGIAYFSSQNRRNRTDYGQIFFRDLNEKGSKFQAFKLSKMDIHPHGISLYKKSPNEKYLFVIHHRKESSSILKFRIKQDSLLLEKEFHHALILHPNDLHAVDENSFYLTNDHTSKKGFKRFFLDFFRIKNGNVVFYDSGKAAVVINKLPYPNGIKNSLDNRFLYITTTLGNKLHIYKHQKNFERRILVDEKYLFSAPDNIELDKYGDLWIACHPNSLKFTQHAMDSTKKSPSQILKVVYLPETDYKFLQEEVFLDSGKTLSGASTAAWWVTDSTNILLVGSVFERKYLELERKL